MIFTPRDNSLPARESYRLDLNLDDLCALNRQSWELNPEDLETPKTINIEIYELETLSAPSVDYGMEDLVFPVVSFDLKELEAFEKEARSRRKTLVIDDDGQLRINFHGTRDRKNIQSICRDGWRVGDGNGLGSGIYFGFQPQRPGQKKKTNTSQIPVPGLPYKSQTLADHYVGNNGALILAEVNWGNFANWDRKDVHQDFKNWCGKNKGKFKYNNGDYMTEWGLARGYRSIKSPNGGYGVMLQHRYNITKKYWKTNHIRIYCVYTPNDKKMERFT